ncbi:MAG: adenylyltransferase/cytidyltransferase family protein [Candidatus Doudnabacteria bacterium]|nr:adenylyltransferase/cytidyltransferase family protein [Candidatus Doudnabacteria bacterium]
MSKEKVITVVVSGGFDPIHPGHIRLFRDAKNLGDRLVVILNNDSWLMKKKRFTFMKQKERKEVIEAIKYVDDVVISKHKHDPEDMSVTEELRRLKPDIFANGGDRTKKNVPEDAVCKRLGIKMVFNVGAGGKIQSSSDLVDKATKAAPRKVNIKIKR